MSEPLLIHCPASGANNRVPQQRMEEGLQPVCGRWKTPLPVHRTPVIEELAEEMAGRARVGKLNVDENPVTAPRFNIRGIPALLVLKGGREIDRIVGVQLKSEIVNRLERAISA